VKKLFLFFVLVLVLLQYRLWSPDGGITEWMRLKNDLLIQESKLEALEARNQTLKNIVINLQTSTEVIETHAREAFHFIAQGETFFRVIPIPDNRNEKPYLPQLPKTKLTIDLEAETVTTAEDAAVETQP
jgi:cell division protein FtsB